MLGIGENKKNTALFIKAISSIYVSMHNIDLVNDTIEGINGSADELPGMTKGKNPNAASLLARIVDKIIDERSKDDMLEFLDLRTIRERLAETDTVTIEFLDNRDKWCRGRFITSEKDSDGIIKSVLYVVEVIDETVIVMRKLVEANGQYITAVQCHNRAVLPVAINNAGQRFYS